MNKLTSQDFLNKIFLLSNNLNKLGVVLKKNESIFYGRQYNLYFSNNNNKDGDLDRIIEVLEYFVFEFDLKKIVADYLREIVSPKSDFIGKYHELLSYYWLKEKGILFNPQVETCVGDTLSENNPTLDGKFELVEIYFDIKNFEVSNNLRLALIDKLESFFPDYMIAVEGSNDESYKTAEFSVLSKICEIKNLVDSEISKKESNVYQINLSENYNLNWIIKLEKKGIKRVYFSENTINPYKWAKENKQFFLKNSPQYTKNSPFFLVCSYSNMYNAGVNGMKDLERISHRSIVRRAFIEFTDSNKVEKIAVPEKLDKKIEKCNLIKYLSGVIFLNVSVGDFQIFLNPNAENKISKSNLENIFDFNIPGEIDDFFYDNY